MTSQGKVPGRFKGFWLINEGTFADALFTLFKPVLSKKFQERVSLTTLTGCSQPGDKGTNEVEGLCD